MLEVIKVLVVTIDLLRFNNFVINLNNKVKQIVIVVHDRNELLIVGAWDEGNYYDYIGNFENFEMRQQKSTIKRKSSKCPCRIVG